MSSKSVRTSLNIPLNRVEGDLEIQAAIEDGCITEARSSGTMYRGFENMMTGRGTLDGLVMTPRICGICSLSHLTAAVEALEDISGTTPPDNARRLRNLALMVEMLQSDIRQSILMFMVDFTNEGAYASHPLSSLLMERYAPLSGTSAIQSIQETRRLLEVVAIIGGQWPHTSFMVPGGVTSSLGTPELLRCCMIIENFQSWYEKNVLGCSISRWHQVDSAQAMLDWLEEKESHRQGDLGLFLRLAYDAGLDTMGQGPDGFLCYGGLPLPEHTEVKGQQGQFIPAGFARHGSIQAFDPANIAEDISQCPYSQKHTSVHPWDSSTNPDPYAPRENSYSWIKAPRYNGHAVETGPLAEMLVRRDPLFTDLIQRQGSSVLSRQLARLTRPARLIPAMLAWLRELSSNPQGKFYHRVKKIPDGQGAGLIQAVRGGLGHWVQIVDQKIEHYQIITPSTWNGSPRDGDNNPGAWEKALEGTFIKNPENPVEAGHVVRSFDPCLVCAVHSLHRGRKKGVLVLGGGF